MNIKVLGCSGGKTIDHAPTSFLIDDRILIDAGTVMDKLDTDELLNIDHLLLTHAHFDHIAEIPFMALTFMEEKINDFHVFASKETTDIVFSHIFNNKVWPDLFTVSKENQGNLHWNTFNHSRISMLQNLVLFQFP